jgi:hypothetical protein
MCGYVDLSSMAGGPLNYLGVLSTWDHVFKNIIYATQSMVGDSVAVRTSPASLSKHPSHGLLKGLSLLDTLEPECFRCMRPFFHGFLAVLVRLPHCTCLYHP